MNKGHSKLENIKYNEFELSSYLEHLEPGLLCPLGCGDSDTLLTCSVLKSHHATASSASSDISYEDTFSADILEQKQVTELSDSYWKPKQIC